MINLIIVEDIPDYRLALKLLFNNTPGFSCAADYADAESCLQAGVYQTVPLAVVDIQLPGMSGIRLVETMMKKQPGLLCMICTSYEDDEKVFQAMEAGAHGYILKSTSSEGIVAAVAELYRGGSPMSSQVARKVVQSFRSSAKKEYALTNREEETLKLLSKGLLYKEIALQLGISIDTVKRHCFNIYEKLHVHNRTEALNKYFEKRT